MDVLKDLLSIFGMNRHIQAALVILTAVLVAKIARWLLTRVFKRLTKQTATEIDDQILALSFSPVFLTLLLLGIWLALRVEQLSGALDYIGSGIIQTLIILLWLLFGVRLSSLLLNWAVQHPGRFQLIQPPTRPLFEIAAKSVLFAVAVYCFLIAWQINPAGWLTSAGVIGIAVGFAARDTLANLFAGVSILADAPYKVGDFIVLDGDRGQVIRIGLRSTRILTRDDIEITIPNSAIANTKIINESGGPTVRHRLRIPVGVAYGADIDRLRTILHGLAQESRYICKDPEPRVRFRGFGDSSLNFELLCWIDNPQDRGITLDWLNTAIYKSLSAAGIEIPFPKRDVYIRQLPEKGMVP